MSKQTVYVIGAGASHEVGLPVGSQLKRNVSELLRGRFDFQGFQAADPLIVESIKLHCKGSDSLGVVEEYIKSAQEIQKALPLAISIDNFLDSRRGDKKIQLCGKLGIVKAILQAEKGSLLYYRKKKRCPLSINFESLEKTWYLDFFKTLTENCTKNDLCERFSYISLIIFNYDRCIEYFIHSALKIYYNLSEEEASKLVLTINIIHPYGSVGVLPWQHSVDEQKMGFGAVPDKIQILELAKRIKTFTEGHDEESKGQIEEIINNCERLVFLGFAFHKLNMEFIKPTVKNDLLKIQACYATTYGMSKSNEKEIMQMLNAVYNKPYTLSQASSFVQAKAIPCKDFFSEYSFGLSFS